MRSPNPALAAHLAEHPAEQRRLAELETLVAPFAEVAGIAIAYVAGPAIAWLAGCAECRCEERSVDSLNGPPAPCHPGREARTLDCGTGHLWVCAPKTRANLYEAVAQLAALLDRQSTLEQQEEMLLDELSSSWESLEAVYEISSDLGLLTNPQELLERILYRAASYRSGVKAALWLERDGMCHPLAQGVTGLEHRPSEGGLLGQVMADRNGIILNGADRIATQAEVETEFRGASNLALVPLTSRDSCLGAMAVWQMEPNGEFDSHDMRFLSALALQAAMVIENDRLHRAELESERLRQEVEIGSKIQQTLLHGQFPDEFPDIQAAARTIPSRMIDGDFYDFIKPCDNRLDVIAGDVMGKGIPAALVGAATKSAFLRVLSRLMSANLQWRLPEPCEIVSAVHQEVVNQLITLESFVTLCYARFDLTSWRVQIVDCGHTATVRYQPRTGQCDLLKGTNMPLGFVADETYVQIDYPLEAGDLFFFYSDGLTEANNERDEAFGEERLMEMVRQHGHLTPEELIAEVYTTLIEFAGREALSDDLTFVAVRVQPAGAPRTVDTLRFLSAPANLGLCREFVRTACGAIEPAVDESFVANLELAINEAVANVMEHAYREEEDHPILLTVTRESDRLVFQITHEGSSFDPAGAPEPSFDGSRDGGFGLFIIAHLVDEVRYGTDDQNRQTITLVKTICGGSHGNDV